MSQKTLKKWTRVSLSNLLKTTKEEAQYFVRSGSIRFLPVFIAYGIAVIFLLKLAQVILM